MELSQSVPKPSPALGLCPRSDLSAHTRARRRESGGRSCPRATWASPPPPPRHRHHRTISHGDFSNENHVQTRRPIQKFTVVLCTGSESSVPPWRPIIFRRFASRRYIGASPSIATEKSSPAARPPRLAPRPRSVTLLTCQRRPGRNSRKRAREGTGERRGLGLPGVQQCRSERPARSTAAENSSPARPPASPLSRQSHVGLLTTRARSSHNL